jgi:acyl-CoA thioesterase I
LSTFRYALATASALAFAGFGAQANAQVVAFGASAVLGYGLPPSQSYPAQLEAMIRARGMNVTVINAGVYDDTTAGMMTRLDTAVPAGTRVVIIDTSGDVFNDSRRGISPAQSQANIAAMEARLATRRIAVIPESTSDLSMTYRLPDHIHLTAEGNRIVAARLLDSVTRALGR